VIVVKKKRHLDHLSIKVEGKNEVYAAGSEKRGEVEEKIVHHIKGMMGIGVEIELVEPKSIARSEGKALRVIDERPKD
jgi:phenylacetate-CoA ligase